MGPELTLDGIAFRLRPVRLDDAERIVELRRAPDRSRFLHETSPSVEAQVRWLASRAERADDHYWAVERLSDGGTEGFLGIYDVDGDAAEWGRWVLRSGSLAAPESAWLVHEAAFTLLGLEQLSSRTLAGNLPVVAFHSRYGARTVRTLPGHAMLDGVAHDAVEARMSRGEWVTAGPRLRAMCERAAALVQRAR